jgi:hypothetical protein
MSPVSSAERRKEGTLTPTFSAWLTSVKLRAAELTGDTGELSFSITRRGDTPPQQSSGKQREVRAMTRPLTVWPAALRLDQAAEYCGLSVDTFKLVCPVKPIEFSGSSRGNRYVKANLDDWLLSLDPNKQSSRTGRRFGEKLGGKSEAAGA